jgi:DNA-binding NarL/FixJ family response regulator
MAVLMRFLVLSSNEINLRGLASVLSDRYPDSHVETYLSAADLLAALTSNGAVTAAVLDPGADAQSVQTLVGKLARQSPQTVIVLLTCRISEQDVFHLFERGVSAFLHSDMSAASFGSAMDLVLSGEKFVPYRLMRRTNAAGHGGLAGERIPGLSARQQEILSLIAKGYSNKRIATELGIKEVTVAFHIRAIFGKLGVSSRTQAVAAVHELTSRALASEH